MIPSGPATLALPIELRLNVPALMAVLPLKVFVPLMSNVPGPDTARFPFPEIVPSKFVKYPPVAVSVLSSRLILPLAVKLPAFAWKLISLSSVMLSEMVWSNEDWLMMPPTSVFRLFPVSV